MYTNLMQRSLFLCCFTLPLFAAVPGTLDTTFNPAGALPGTQRTSIGTALESFGSQVVIQSDGKIVAAGTAAEGGINKFAVVRLNNDGTIDTTFNSGGSLAGTNTTPIDNASAQSFGQAVVLQPDGKIVVAGYVTDGLSGLNRFAVARFNPDGTLDTTFNSGGTLPGTNSTPIDDPAKDSYGYSVQLQPDGKIVIAGEEFDTITNLSKFAIARFNSDGTLDTTFNSAGTLPGTNSTPINNPANYSAGASVVIQPDNKIVVGGTVNESGLIKFGLARFTSNGVLDATFNSSGSLPGTTSTSVDNPPIPNNVFVTVALQQNGKIVIGGDLYNGISKFGIARFNVDGSLDTTFNALGSLPGTFSFYINSNGQTSSGTSVAIQRNGQIVMGGSLSNGINIDQFAVARLNPNGSLDTTFNPSGSMPGTASTPFNPPSTFDPSFSLAIQSDNKIVLVGFIDESEAIAKFAFARFNGDLSIVDVCANS